MSIPPWRATCIQVESRLAALAPDRDSAWQVIRANLAVAVKAIELACATEAPRLVVLPEFAFQGPPRATPVAEWIDKACCQIPGPITQTLAEVARARGLYIAGNQFEVDPLWPDRYFNSSFLLNPAGEVILRYRRINTASWTSPHDILDDYLAAYGTEGLLPVVETELGRLAIFPCGEIAVPELARALMLRGAEVFLHPNNEPLSEIADAHKLCRAAENKCWLISCNVAGTAGFSNSLTGGHSQIVDFNGTRLAFEPDPGPSVACSALIDIQALQAARADTGMGNGLLRQRLEIWRGEYDRVLYPANQLKTPITTAADLGPVHQAALANLRAAGILR